MKHLFILILVLTCSAQRVTAQIDSLFWFAPPWVTPDHDGNVQMAFRISTFGNAATVRIQQPAGTYDTTFVVPANSLADVPVSHLVNSLESKPADAILTSGVKITSDELITVVYDFISDMITISPGTPNNPETYSLKGQNGMGTEFVTPFQTLWWNQNQATDRNGDGTITQPKQYFSVVATEDNTTIYIKPNANVVGHPADITYAVFLPFAGNVYTCENVVMNTNVAGNNLSGSIVSSDKPVSITINDDSIRTGGGGCYDLQGDQVVPTDVIGNEYIVNLGFLFAGSNESIFIIPAENFTTINVTDLGGTTTQMMNQGETWQYSLTDPLTHVISDKPVYLVHMSGYGCETGLAILPPLNCAGSDEVSFSRNNGQQFLLNLLCEAGDETSFTLTNDVTGNVPILPGAFSPVPGTGGAWVGAQIDFPVGQIPSGSQSTLTNSAGFFSMGVINGGASTGCLYHYMSSFLRRVYTDAGTDVTVCNGEPVINLSGSVSGGTTTGIWEILNGTGTLNTPTNLSTTYVPSPSDYAQGTLTFVLSSTGNCDPKRDTVVVNFVQSPYVEAGSDDSYCKNNIGAVPINGNVTFAAGATWTGGVGGAFGNPGSLSTTYTPSPADLAIDSVVLYLTSSGSFFACPDDEDTVVIYFTVPPTVVAGPDLVLCSNTNLIDLSGSVTGATTTGVWSSTGTGAFSPSATTLGADYNVSSLDTLVGSIKLYLETTNNGNCLMERDSIQVTFLDPPNVNITTNDSICSNLAFFDLTGTLSFGFTPTWSTTGFGSINSPNSINTQYNITAVDTTAGFVDVFLESDAGICPSIQDSLRVTFIDPPYVNAGFDDQSCDNELIILSGVISGFSNNGTWSSMGTGSFIGSPQALNTTYSPSAVDIANGSVTLILTSDIVFGCPAVNDPVVFTFNESPNAQFNSTTECAEDNTIFSDLSNISSGAIDSWQWDFDDASSSITQNPIHAYSYSDTFDVQLIVGSNNGCYDTIVSQVVVHPNPVADFNPTVGCENTPITFSDLTSISSGSITNWLYNFGSSTSSLPNPTYTYTGAGTQSVTLTVTSALGCTDDTTMAIVVNPSPTAEFSFEPNPAMVGESIDFTDESTGAGLVDWYWEFGDGEANNAQNPIHTYEIGGGYEIIMVVTDGNGCMDTIVKNIIIALPPVLPTGFTPNGDDENDVFIIRGGPFNEVDFKVYNKWGEVVFATTDPNEGWNGTFLGQPAPLGVYTWTFVVAMANDAVVKQSGDVTLIR